MHQGMLMAKLLSAVRWHGISTVSRSHPCIPVLSSPLATHLSQTIHILLIICKLQFLARPHHDCTTKRNGRDAVYIGS